MKKIDQTSSELNLVENIEIKATLEGIGEKYGRFIKSAKE